MAFLQKQKEEVVLDDTCYEVHRRFAAILGAQEIRVTTYRAHGLCQCRGLWKFQLWYQ